MSWSISRAAKETGLSKSTISRAIKSGRISAQRQDDGAYLIEPVELFRAYPRPAAQPTPDAHHDAVRNAREEPSATTSYEIEILRVKLAMTEEMLTRERENARLQLDTVEDLRRRLDAATERVLALSQPPQPSADTHRDVTRNPPRPTYRRGWWPWRRT